MNHVCPRQDVVSRSFWKGGYGVHNSEYPLGAISLPDTVETEQDGMSVRMRRVEKKKEQARLSHMRQLANDSRRLTFQRCKEHVHWGLEEKAREAFLTCVRQPTGLKRVGMS